MGYYVIGVDVVACNFRVDVVECNFRVSMTKENPTYMESNSKVF